MKELKPKISVLMSVFNGEKWLAESIESIINQSYKNFEFIIINDGSKDNSLEIIERYAIKDKRIKIINNRINVGLTKCLNTGLLIARGEWIARIDCDDISLKDRLKSQYEFVLKKNCKLIGSFSVEINDKDLRIKICKCPTRHYLIKQNLLNQKIFFAHSTAFFHRNSAIKLGNYRPRIKNSQDYDLWLRFSEKYKLGCLPKITVKLRNHSARITNNKKGIPQKSYAYLALVSYYLRKFNLNFNDPINSNDIKLYEYYKNFIFDSLKKYRLIEFYKKLFEYKSLSFNSKYKCSSLYSKIIYFFKIFNTFKLLIILLRLKFSGEFISKRIAKDWILKIEK